MGHSPLVIVEMKLGTLVPSAATNPDAILSANPSTNWAVEVHLIQLCPSLFHKRIVSQ